MAANGLTPSPLPGFASHDDNDLTTDPDFDVHFDGAKGPLWVWRQRQRPMAHAPVLLQAVARKHCWRQDHRPVGVRMIGLTLILLP